MRLPASVEGTLNAYLAMKAILSTALAAESAPPINSLAVPGLGTGIGRLDPRTAAHQMFAAYRETILGQEFIPESLHDAALQEHKLIYATDFDEGRPETPGQCL
jgi:O-acetyl-ADP-ribose deacetylase (regulator of RNase III)